VRKLKQQLQGGTTAYTPPKPKQPKQAEPQSSPPREIPPERKLSAAEQAAAAALRTRQQRGLLGRRTQRGASDPETFLTWRDLFELGVVSSKTQARRMWERGDFPRPVHLSERVIAFRASEVAKWMKSRKKDWQPSDEAA